MIFSIIMIRAVEYIANIITVQTSVRMCVHVFGSVAWCGVAAMSSPVLSELAYFFNVPCRPRP